MGRLHGGKEMNKAKELKDIISITELNPSKIYLIGVKGNVKYDIMNVIYHNLQRLGIEKVLIAPEDWIKSVRELSEEEADRIDEKMQKAISDKKEKE